MFKKYKQIYKEGKYKRIVITRNIQPVGRDIGFLPGDEKKSKLFLRLLRTTHNDRQRQTQTDRQTDQYTSLIAKIASYILFGAHAQVSYI